MNFLLFLATLIHVASGLLFCGLPLIAFGELCRVQQAGRDVIRESLLHSLGFGVTSLLIGSLMAGAQWDASFEATWEILGNRWLFLIAEMIFSMALVGVVLVYLDRTANQKVVWWLCILLLFIAATNALYHFPTLMVLTRELRHDPSRYQPEQSMAGLIFSPPILMRWVHLAIAAILLSAVWHRLISSWLFFQLRQRLIRQAHQDHQNKDNLVMANPDVIELRQVDWRGGWWAMAAIVGLWATGLSLFLVLPVVQVSQLTSITSGKSNQLMVGVVLATFVGVRCLANSTSPSRAMRVLDVSLLLVTIASMIDAVSRT